MRVVLIKNHSSLGYKDDVVEVKSGYARNYLIPQGIAIYGSEKNIKDANENRKQTEMKIEKKRQEARAIADKLATMVFDYEVVCDKDKNIITKIKADDIINIINDKTNYNLEKTNKVIFQNKFLKIGEYTIQVKIFREVSAFIKLNVKEKVKEKEVKNKQ